FVSLYAAPPTEIYTLSLHDALPILFNINLMGVMRATRKALPIFLEKGEGVIINTASAAGIAGSRAGAAYTASKHAVVGYTKNVGDRKSTRLNSSHVKISYAVFCLKK